MKRLSRDTRALILRCFTEGVGVNSTARMADVSKNTVLKLLADLGPVCREYQQKAFVGLDCKKLQVDEIWAFTHAKTKNLRPELKGIWGFGDTWSWISICADCRLVPSWLVGPRDSETANSFIADLAGRLAHRIQLTSDGHSAYIEAVESAFGADIDFAQLIKAFDLPIALRQAEHRYSPGVCCGIRKKIIRGEPARNHISTSYSERLNLEIRCKNRRLTRLTTGFSRKVANLEHSMDVGFMVYNFVKVHSSLKVSPAMQAGVTDHLWSYDEVVALLEATEPNATEIGKRRKDSRSHANIPH